MFRNIIDDQSVPAERPLHLTGMPQEIPPKVIRRNVRQDPTLQPGDEIYDRARIIFSRARRAGGSRASSIL